MSEPIGCYKYLILLVGTTSSTVTSNYDTPLVGTTPLTVTTNYNINNGTEMLHNILKISYKVGFFRGYAYAICLHLNDSNNYVYTYTSVVF